MPIARITPIGGDLYHVHIVEAGHPDQGLPGSPGHPDQGLPGRPPHVSTGPVWPGRPVDPGFGVPGGGGRPDQGLPGNPNFPDNSLPTTPPPAIPPNTVLVMVRLPTGQWKYAAVQAGAAPTPLPEPPPTAQPKA
jgi:hypothetical protein